MVSVLQSETTDAVRSVNTLDVALPLAAGSAEDERVRIVAAWCAWWYRYRGAHELSLGKQRSLRVDDGLTAGALLGGLRQWLPSALGALDLECDDPQDDEAPVAVCVRRIGTSWSLHLALADMVLPETLAARLPGQIAILAEALERDPTRPLDHLPLLSEAQARALCEQWTGPRVALPSGPIAHVIATHARDTPDAVAVQDAHGTTSYAELDARAEQIARVLDERGVGRETAVVVCMDACVSLVAAMLGIFKAGGVYVPLDPSYPAGRLRTICEDVQPRVILTLRAHADALRDYGPVVVLDELDDAPAASVPLARDITADQTAYIVYTSGTTGRPKGVMLSQANLAHYIAVAQRQYEYDQRDVIVAMARPGFSISFFELLSPLASGGRLRLLTRDEVLDFDTMLGVLETVTCIHASPAWWRKMLVHIDAQPSVPDRFANVRHASSGGDMVPPDVVASLERIFVNAEVFVIYGSSEIACMGCSYPVPRGRVVTRTRVGRPFPNMLVRLLDPAGGVVPPGFRGEVCFGGAGLAKGYLNVASTNFVEMDGTRLYRTGDVGVIEPDDQLRLVGRRDFQVKIRGVRIEPAEIEAHLRSMPEVRDAVVTAATLDDGERKLVAYLVPAGDREPTPRTLRARLREELPEAMVPTIFVGLDALPVNHNNKVDRRNLPPPDAGRLTDAPGGAAPTTADERALLELWRSALRQPEAGIHDDFFDLGGDSLTGAELMTQIDHRLGVALPVSELLRHPTVAELAPRLAPDVRAQQDDSAVVCLRPGSARPAFFFIHDGEGETIVYRNLARHLPGGCPVYGVHPKRSGLHPILHTRIPEMVDYYVDEIRGTCSGPYVVGGLCIGGFLAFEVARALQARGEEVALVALLDAPHVAAPKKGATSKRIASLGGALGGLGPQTQSKAELFAKAVSTVARKAFNTASYELSARTQRQLTTARIRSLRFCLDHGMTPPASLRHIGVDPMLRFAEQEYVVPEPYAGEVLLVRATRADPALDDTWVDDTPYSEIIDAPANGWEGKASALHVEDVDAGHSSMLQQAKAPVVAEILSRHIERVQQQPAMAKGLQTEDERITAFVDGCSLLVVMVSYRSAGLAVEALASLEPERAQHRDLRVVIVDNTSGDDAEVLSRTIDERGWTQWVTVRVAPDNGGFASGNNLALRPALRAARPPEAVWLLNPDTRVEPGAGMALLEVLRAQPEAGLVGSCMVEPSGRVWGRAFRFPSLLSELEAAVGLAMVSRMLEEHAVAREMGDAPEPVDWISGASLMIRLEALQSVGLFDEGYFLYFEETDFCLAAQRAGWQAWYAPDSRVVHFAGSSTGMSDWFSTDNRLPGYYFESRRRFFLKNYGLAYATMTDAVRVGGLGFRSGLRWLRRKERRVPPWLLWDSLRSAALLGPGIESRRHV